MKNEYSVNSFATFTVKRKVTGTSSTEQRVNVYEWLNKEGFGQGNLNGKTIFFHVQNGTVKPSSVMAMRNAFLRFIEVQDFIDYPKGVTRHDLLEWFYIALPPKRNQLFKEHMFKELSEEQKHQYSMEDDSRYRHNFHISQLLGQLSAWGFKKTLDMKSSFSKDADLYYKKVGEGQYLVFNHFNKDGKNNSDGFDCWLAPFKKESQIGKVPNHNLQDIRLSFQLDRDLSLIERYVS